MRKDWSSGQWRAGQGEDRAMHIEGAVLPLVVVLVVLLLVQGEGARVRRVVGGRKAAPHRFPWQVTDDCDNVLTFRLGPPQAWLRGFVTWAGVNVTWLLQAYLEIVDSRGQDVR